jgi:hypothetical protein
MTPDGPSLPTRPPRPAPSKRTNELDSAVSTPAAPPKQASPLTRQARTYATTNMNTKRSKVFVEQELINPSNPLIKIDEKRVGKRET